jgi:hypothetical protein
VAFMVTPPMEPLKTASAVRALTEVRVCSSPTATSSALNVTKVMEVRAAMFVVVFFLICCFKKFFYNMLRVMGVFEFLV